MEASGRRSREPVVDVVRESNLSGGRRKSTVTDQENKNSKMNENRHKLSLAEFDDADRLRDALGRRLSSLICGGRLITRVPVLPYPTTLQWGRCERLQPLLAMPSIKTLSIQGVMRSPRYWRSSVLYLRML